jgi:hypothetical protein
VDVSNGYNEMSRAAISEGLQDMPANLHWIRKAFNAFYSGDVLLYFQRKEDVYHLVSEIGTVQGDGASNIYFNAGLQRAFNKLRDEYPEVMLVKYIDDVMGGLSTSSDEFGQPLMCAVDEERAYAGFGAYPMVPNVNITLPPTVPTHVPLPLAITKRWQFLVGHMCGLRAQKKQGIAGRDVQQQAFGDPNDRGIPVFNGLEIAGSPIGTTQYVADKLDEIVEDKVKKSFDAVARIPNAQEQHLLGSQCCGNACVQHLWQVLNPQDTQIARTQTDFLAYQAVKRCMGISNDLPRSCVQQIFLPQRFGGLGYRRANDVANAAFIGGFALAAHGPHNIASVCPELREDITSPETSTLPSMIALCLAWKQELQLTNRAYVLAKAVAADAIAPPRPPEDEPSEVSPSSEEYMLEKQDTMYELRWKAEFLLGKTVPPEQNCAALDLELLDRAAVSVEGRRSTQSWTDEESSKYEHPENHPSLLAKWSQQGGMKFQRLFGRLRDSYRWLDFSTI